ncbi:NB-ARC domains-containing protein [Tanacetum coccineum]
MIGICGISGIGKTTLAKAIYNLMFIHFEGSCFCEDVRKQQDLTRVQMQLIDNIMKTRALKISSAGQGIMVIKKMMSSKPILLILDDVDDHEQLEALAGSAGWFCPGSLIILTGKDKQLLRSHRVDEIHDMDFLDEDRSLELFRSYAFKEKVSSIEFKEVSQKVVKYVQGHPLALKVLGRFLYDKTVGQWVSGLVNWKSSKYTNMKVLVDKSLITISGDMSLQMHDLIQAMARGIVREESIMPGKQIRLWNLSQVYDLLSGKKKVEIADAVEVLVLLLEKSGEKCLRRLKFMKLRHCCNLTTTSDFSEITNLEELDLEGCVNLVTVHPSIEMLKRLVVLNMTDFSLNFSYCNLEQVPESIGGLSCLKYLFLKGNNFTSLPESLSQLSELEDLYVDGCKKLEVLHELSPSLYIVSADDCTSLCSITRSSKEPFKINCPKMFTNLAIDGQGSISETQCLDSSITSHGSTNRISSFLQYAGCQNNIFEFFRFPGSFIKRMANSL